MVNENWHDLTLTINEVVRTGTKWFPVMTIVAFLPYFLLWGIPEGPEWSGTSEAIGDILTWTAIALLVYAASAVVHELIHAAAMIACGVPVSAITFGGRLKEGIIYVHTAEVLSARTYRIILITPAILQGIVPIIAGTASGLLWMVLYGYVMLTSAIGDLAILHLTRRLPADARVQDHPTDVGCRVLLPSGSKLAHDTEASAS